MSVKSVNPLQPMSYYLENAETALKSDNLQWAIQLISDAQDLFPSQAEALEKAQAALWANRVKDFTNIIKKIPKDLTPPSKPPAPNSSLIPTVPTTPNPSTPTLSRRKAEPKRALPKETTPTPSIPKINPPPSVVHTALKASALLVPETPKKPPAQTVLNPVTPPKPKAMEISNLVAKEDGVQNVEMKTSMNYEQEIKELKRHVSELQEKVRILENKVSSKDLDEEIVVQADPKKSRAK